MKLKTILIIGFVFYGISYGIYCAITQTPQLPGGSIFLITPIFMDLEMYWILDVNDIPDGILMILSFILTALIWTIPALITHKIIRYTQSLKNNR